MVLTILLLAAFTLTSMCVETAQVVFEPKTLVSHLCPEVTIEMLQNGLDYGASVYRYDLITPAVTEFTSLQALLLSLLNCLATQDSETCTVLAACSNRIQQVRSRHVALWLREDFEFPQNDMKTAMARLDSMVAGGLLVLDPQVLSVLSSLADSYGISLQTKIENDDLALELENAVVNNNPYKIITLANEGGNVNGSTQLGESLIHLAVRNGSTSSIVALGFMKTDLEVLNADGATPMEEAIKIDSVPAINALIMAGANIKKQLHRGNSYLHIAASSGMNEALRTLLEAGLEPDVRNQLGNTSMQVAVDVGNVKGVEILLERCGNSSLMREEAKSLLRMTVVSSNIDMFRAFLKCNTLQDLRFENNDTLVHLIVRSNNATELLKILKDRRVTLNIRNNDGLAPLHTATDPSVVEALLEMGADVNITTEKGETALNIASTKGYLDVVKVLVKYDAGVSIKDNQNETTQMAATTPVTETPKKCQVDLPINNIDRKGWTALHHAAAKGQIDVVNSLLDCGADLRARTGKEVTPLMIASYNGHSDVVKLLIDRGAPINDKNIGGLTALHIAVQEGEDGVVALLLKGGADVKAITKVNQWTALHIAAEKGHVGVVTLLSQHGADLRARTVKDWTPLMIASYHGHSDVVKLLLDQGAAINDKNNFGFTALHLAAQEGKVGVVTLLLKRGADLRAMSDSGATPLMKAASKNHSDVVRILKDREAYKR